ncbi:hypothetical protein [Blastopirellula retiformator]|uniref:Uncharacterized protein n=1 Tax=Blastopirellula retiformator TaxID=2527970 RepID=A0A5C5VMS3_9BACT|nr:hypothetical protein [Blastopirellula retiformator]TWT39201.1 hypothetical protein Enr8_08970 [Blastopirellula retiformator]
MSHLLDANFVDRRDPNRQTSQQHERRQFSNSHSELSDAAREIADAIDGYKIQHRRRFVTYEEIFQVISELGYHK